MNITICGLEFTYQESPERILSFVGMSDHPRARSEALLFRDTEPLCLMTQAAVSDILKGLKPLPSERRAMERYFASAAMRHELNAAVAEAQAG